MLQNEVCVILKLNKSILGTDIDIMLTGIYISPPSPSCHNNNIDPYVILNKSITLRSRFTGSRFTGVSD